MQVVPAAVSSGAARLVGPLAAARRLKLAIQLPLSDQAGLDALLQQLYDPASPNYHQYLGNDEFTARFGPRQADYDAVVAWAEAHGLAVTGVTANRHLLDVEGPVAAVNSALHVRMNAYRLPGGTREFFAPDREPALDLAIALTRISGLDNYLLPQHHLTHGTPAQVAAALAHANGSGPGGQFLPSDMRRAYYGNGSLTGAGQTVGIFSFDGYKPADVQFYYNQTGMSSNVPINNVLVNGYSGACDDGGAGCDDGEQVIDIVNVIGMAPGITQVLFYEGDSGPDILNRMATDNLAKVLSCSWGSSDLGPANDAIFQQFQAQGQTFVNATGDDGMYNSQTWLPPSLNSLVLQVGGTDLSVTSAGAWNGETGWGGSGGGFYNRGGYSIPSYQQSTGVITAANAGSSTLRNDPDVAAEADQDNPLVSNGQLFSGYGGTSFAAPRWAGLIALANEQAQANGQGTLGFVNQALYSAALSAQGSNFHDVSSGNNAPSLGSGAGFNAVTGFDLVTGWGSPKGAALINTLSGALSASRFVIAPYPSALNLMPGSSVTLSLIVSTPNGFSGNVTPTVSGLPAGVSASFSPAVASVATPSTLTLTSTSSASPGLARVTLTGTSGTAAPRTAFNLLVGSAPQASVAPTSMTLSSVPLGTANQTLQISNTRGSVPLQYSVSAYASSDGSCTGAAPWLAAAVSSGSVSGDQPTALSVEVTPSAANLGVGSYAGELCLSTNDAGHATIAVPVTLAVIPGPHLETIFRTGFEGAETAGGIFRFVVNQPVEDTQAGSSLDLATGSYHTFSSGTLDNINLYDDGTGLQVYWYDDVVPPGFTVGGLVPNTGAANYSILQSGALIGPAARFATSATPLSTFWSGVDGYLGIVFRNDQTNALNYGYIHLQTSGNTGYPAQVLEYAFDSSGAAIRIP